MCFPVWTGGAQVAEARLLALYYPPACLTTTLTKEWIWTRPPSMVRFEGRRHEKKKGAGSPPLPARHARFGSGSRRTTRTEMVMASEPAQRAARVVAKRVGGHVGCGGSPRYTCFPQSTYFLSP